MDLLYHLTGKNLIDLWKKEVMTSLLFCTEASQRKDLVTHNFLLKICATPPRTVVLRLSSPLLKKEVITSLLFCTRLCLVPRRGLEPPRIAPLVPKTSAYTNSATWAYYNIQFWRPRAESNRRIRVLQTLALPLGD